MLPQIGQTLRPGLFSFNVVTHAATQAYKTALTSYEKLYDRWLETVGAEGTESGSKLDHMLSEALEKCYEDLKPKLVKWVFTSSRFYVSFLTL